VESLLFLLNDLKSEHSALVLDLRFSNANGTTRPAIGAVAVVSFADGRRLVGQIDGGNGHSGRRAPEIHFGLGAIKPGATMASSQTVPKVPRNAAYASSGA
jgi:enediyne biosynthesis protein E4